VKPARLSGPVPAFLQPQWGAIARVGAQRRSRISRTRIQILPPLCPPRVRGSSCPVPLGFRSRPVPLVSLPRSVGQLLWWVNYLLKQKVSRPTGQTLSRSRLPGIFSPLSEKGFPSPAGILFSFPAGIFSRRAADLSRRGLGHQFCGSPTYQKFVTRPNPWCSYLARASCPDWIFDARIASPQRHGSTELEVQDTKVFEILSAFVTSW
jgi:hypothetical protein